MSHDQIQLSTLKGEGELKNLELNEEVLTELLELPSWLRLSGATCNRVAVRIQWTKLKSVPIHLSLDEVRKCFLIRPILSRPFGQKLEELIGATCNRVDKCKKRSYSFVTR